MMASGSDHAHRSPCRPGVRGNRGLGHWPLAARKVLLCKGPVPNRLGQRRLAPPWPGTGKGVQTPRGLCTLRRDEEDSLGCRIAA